MKWKGGKQPSHCGICGENRPLNGEIWSSDYHKKLTCKSCTEGKWQVFKYQEGHFLVPEQIISLQTVTDSSLYLDTVLGKVIHSTTLVKSRLHSSDGWQKAISNKYIISKGWLKQWIKIQVFFLYSFNMWCQKNEDFLTDFYFLLLLKHISFSKQHLTQL